MPKHRNRRGDAASEQKSSVPSGCGEADRMASLRLLQRGDGPASVAVALPSVRGTHNAARRVFQRAAS